jgi:hypothetical protein
MTTPKSEQPTWREWAAERLGVSVEASISDTSIAFLGSLEALDFVAPDELRFAFQLKTAPEIPGPQCERALKAFQKSQAQALRASVESFAGRYWSLPPEERQAEHARLLEAAKGFPTIRSRLDQLQGGLSADAAVANADDPVHAIACKIQEIYALAPIERAVQRHEWLNSLYSDAAGLHAFDRFFDEHPGTAALEKGLTRRTLNERAQRDYKALRTCRLFAMIDSNVADDAASSSELGFVSFLVQAAIWICCPAIIVYLLFTFLHEAARPDAGKTHDGARKAPLNPFKDYHLEVVALPDGSLGVEGFDKERHQVPLGEATKRLMGSRELLLSEMQKRGKEAGGKRKLQIDKLQKDSESTPNK